MYISALSMKISTDKRGCLEYQDMRQNAMRIPFRARTHCAVRDIGNYLQKSSS